MSGSIKWQVYTDDYAQEWAVKLDESNGIANGFRDFVPADTGTIFPLPNYIKMRYVNCVRPGASGEDIKRRFPQGTVAAMQTRLNTLVASDGTNSYNVLSTVGESWRNMPKAIDTGINDGTVE